VSKQLLLKDLENLKESLQDDLLSELIQGVDLEPSPESLQQIEEAISAFERAHGMTSEQMLEKLDCEVFEENPELGRWAALYCSYKELKQSA